MGLVASGVTCGEVSKRYGVSQQTVSQWCQKVRWADEDAAALRALREPSCP